MRSVRWCSSELCASSSAVLHFPSYVIQPRVEFSGSRENPRLCSHCSNRFDEESKHRNIRFRWQGSVPLENIPQQLSTESIFKCRDFLPRRQPSSSSSGFGSTRIFFSCGFRRRRKNVSVFPIDNSSLEIGNPKSFFPRLLLLV